jgi:hypothetical protein
MTRPIPNWALRRTPEGNLLLDFYNVNGIYSVVVLESENRIRIENIRKNKWYFLNDMHALTGAEGGAGLVRAWGIWNEVAMWSLLFFCASGVCQWLSRRPALIPGWVALAASSVTLAVFWAVFR